MGGGGWGGDISTLDSTHFFVVRLLFPKVAKLQTSAIVFPVFMGSTIKTLTEGG